MADNVPITAGTGTTIATDELVFNAITVQMPWSKIGWGALDAFNPITAGAGGLPVLANIAANFAPAQVSVATTATAIFALRTARQSVTVVNSGTVAVYLGGSGVTTTTGVLLPGIIGASVTISTTAAIYGIVAAGTQGVTGYELY